MKSSKRLPLALTLAAALVTAGLGPATAVAAADDPAPVGPSYAPDDPHAADDPHSTAPLPYDLAVYSIAKQNGIDLRTAAARFEQQQQFNTIGSDLADTYGSDQFDAWITSSTDGQTLHVRTDNTSVRNAFTDKLGSSVDIIAEPARVVSLSKDLDIDLPADVDAIYVDVETLGVVVDSHGADPAATARAVQHQLDPKEFPAKVVVKTYPAAAQDSTNLSGGSTLGDCAGWFTGTSGSRPLGPVGEPAEITAAFSFSPPTG